MGSDFIFSKHSNLALKYRPKLFSDLVGQEHISSNLQAVVDSRKVPQSFLLSGPSGTGKTSTARVLARYLNCKDLKTNENGYSIPCEECSSCKLDILKHPDVIEMNMADARGIDDVRQLLRNAQMSPTYNFRIFLLDEIHQLTGASKEIILKPLEEPPSRTIWILCTTNPEKLTPTIRGRCRQLEVKPLSTKACAKLLRRVAIKEGCESLTKEQFLTISELTGAQPRAALQALGAVLDNLKNIKDTSNLEDLAGVVKQVVTLPPYKTAISYLKAIYSGKYEEALVAIDTTDEKITLAKIILEYHYKACRYHISPQLRSKEYFDRLLYGEIDKYKLPIDLMAGILNRLVRCNSLVREFEVDAQFVLTSATMDIVQVVRENLEK